VIKPLWSGLLLVPVVALFVFVLPEVSGADWPAIGAALAGIDPVATGGLLLLALAAIWADTYVIRGSLPGLRWGHAFLIGTVGTAVGNVVPFGGVVGTAVTFAMGTRWGHSTTAVSTSVLVTGVWNVVGRLLLPLVVLVTAAVAGIAVDDTVLMAGLGLSVLLVAAVVIVSRERTVRVLDRLLGRWAAGVVPGIREQMFVVVRRNWLTMTSSTIVVSVLQGLLLWSCLVVAGVRVEAGLAVVLIAVNRMLTLIVITPNGSGLMESGTTALLLAWGYPGTEAVAGVLLFTLCTFGTEVVVGGVSWSVWTLSGRRTSPTHA